MKASVTNRGFGLIEFEESNGERCTLQESSSAHGSFVWLGIHDPVILEQGYDKSWPARMRPLAKETIEKMGLVVFGRMHLEQETVKALLPALQHFADTGRLPPTESKEQEG